MTVKQKFDKIDQSKLAQAQVDILKMMADKTDNFKTKDKETLEKIDASLDKIIAKLQDSNPDALKSTARKTSTAKTATKSRKSGKTAMQLAKEIRKPNESWNEAVKRAGSMMRGDAKQASKVVTSELEKLKAFINKRKQLKSIAGTDLLRDATRKAKPKGSRKSKDGNVYYEYRENRTDRLAPNYPKNAPLLAKGGGIKSIKWANDDNKKLGIWLLTSVDGNKILSKSKNAKELEDNVMAYYDKKGSVAKMTWDEDADDGLSWVTFGDLFDEVKSIFADGGYNDGIEEDIDMTDDYVLRVNKGVQPKDRASMREWMGITNESREAMAYELGGATMQYDLAGNTGGGTAGLNADMPLSGVSGTKYTDLVGETGALSSGEMFARGGGVRKVGNRVYSLGRNWTNDHNHTNKSEKHEVNYSRKGFFANGGAMMANQQIMADASQQYVNYYLGEGATGGMYARGGMMPKPSTSKHRND